MGIATLEPEVTAAIITVIFGFVVYIIRQIIFLFHEKKQARMNLLETLLSDETILRNLRFFWRQEVSLRVFYRSQTLHGLYDSESLEEGERVEIYYMSGSQAHAFADAAKEMTERVRRLGPSPLRKQ